MGQGICWDGRALSLQLYTVRSLRYHRLCRCHTYATPPAQLPKFTRNFPTLRLTPVKTLSALLPSLQRCAQGSRAPRNPLIRPSVPTEESAHSALLSYRLITILYATSSKYTLLKPGSPSKCTVNDCQPASFSWELFHSFSKTPLFVQMCRKNPFW